MGVEEMSLLTGDYHVGNPGVDGDLIVAKAKGGNGDAGKKETISLASTNEYRIKQRGKLLCRVNVPAIDAAVCVPV